MEKKSVYFIFLYINNIMKTSNNLKTSMIKQLELIKLLNQELLKVKNENELLKEMVKNKKECNQTTNNSNRNNSSKNSFSKIVLNNKNENNNNTNKNNKSFEKNKNSIRRNEEIRYLDYLIRRANENNYYYENNNNKVDEFINSLIILVK